MSDDEIGFTGGLCPVMRRVSCNPETRHRSASAVLALAGCSVSIYLSVYQYGGLTQVWEPLFGNGSIIVLNSGILDWLSHALGFQVHDAAVGAAGYFIEAGLALTGKRNRPAFVTWLDVVYGGLVLLMGLTSLVLVVLQAAVFQSWCTLCLTSAVISEAIVLLSRHEIAESAIFLVRWWRRDQD